MQCCMLDYIDTLDTEQVVAWWKACMQLRTVASGMRSLVEKRSLQCRMYCRMKHI
jgi:hypothetical protein